MKQFFVFIYSKFSQPSRKCEDIIHSLSSDISFNFLCIDNIENRKIIQSDPTLDIQLVPCLLIVNASDGKITKYEGKKCHDYLIQFQKQQTPIAQPQPLSMISQQQQHHQQETFTPPPTPQPVQPQPAVVVQQKQPSIQKQQQPPQTVQPKPKPIPQISPQEQLLLSEEDSFNRPPDTNQTSSLVLSENDDEDEQQQPQQYNAPPPIIPFPKQQQQQQQQISKGGKPSLLAQATAMQKSRLADEDVHKKK